MSHSPPNTVNATIVWGSIHDWRFFHSQSPIRILMNYVILSHVSHDCFNHCQSEQNRSRRTKTRDVISCRMSLGGRLLCVQRVYCFQTQENYFNFRSTENRRFNNATSRSKVNFTHTHRSISPLVCDTPSTSSSKMTPAIDSAALVDENSKSKDMESLEPLTAKPDVTEPPKKRSRTGVNGEFVIVRNNLADRPHHSGVDLCG